MKKLISLITILLIVLSMLLVGCTTNEGSDETVEVVDEDGALIGEAIRFGNQFKLNSLSLSSKYIDLKHKVACLPESMEGDFEVCLPGYGNYAFDEISENSHPCASDVDYICWSKNPSISADYYAKELGGLPCGKDAVMIGYNSDAYCCK